MIVVEEMGHKAIAAKLDDPDALLAESAQAIIGRIAAAAAGGHRHGPRRPRQDVAARHHSPHAGRQRRGRRHHAAHRRVSRRDVEGRDHLPRHARPRGVHGDARARRQGHRHRGAGRCGRRRRHAADQGSDRAREGRQRADRRRDQQDRQAGSEPGPRQAGAGRGERAAGGIRRRRAVRAGVGQDRRWASTSCSTPSCCRPKCSSSRRRATRRRKASSSNRVSTRARARWRRSWCIPERSSAATSCSPARCSGGCAR